jgi:hypothetical protein
LFEITRAAERRKTRWRNCKLTMLRFSFAEMSTQDFPRLDKRQQYLVFVRLPGVTGLAGHYAFFALSWRSPISAIHFELEAAGTSAVKRHG